MNSDDNFEQPLLILAYASPRRSELLKQLHINFKQHAADIDETHRVGESCIDYVIRIATEKALAVAKKLSIENDNKSLILGADTCGEIDGCVLGKPHDYEDAKRLLTMLSGQTHLIHSAFALSNGDKIYSECVTSKVKFAQLTEQQIEDYWRTGEPHDKAGAYAIQRIGAQFITRLEGSYSAVVGLPLFEVTQALSQFNFRIV